MGTQGCINYNPMISLRQQGYPIVNPPTDKETSLLLIHESEQPGDIQSKKEESWAHEAMQPPLRIDYGSNIGSEWYESLSLELPYLSPDLRKKCKKSKTQIELKRKLEEARAGKRATVEEADHYRKSAELLAQKVRIEEAAKFKTWDCLRVTDVEMCFRREERNRVMAD
ncbi:hypothetical protein CR513_34175, partial [Mucuna pruriens]